MMKFEFHTKGKYNTIYQVIYYLKKRKKSKNNGDNNTSNI